MSDIVERLREFDLYHADGADCDAAKKICTAAADEIERLKRDLRAARAALVMIRGVVAGVLEDEQMKGGEFA
jgi:hypothetical protein